MAEAVRLRSVLDARLCPNGLPPPSHKHLRAPPLPHPCLPSIRGLLPQASSLAWPDEPFRSEFLKLLKQLEMPRFTRWVEVFGRSAVDCGLQSGGWDACSGLVRWRRGHCTPAVLHRPTALLLFSWGLAGGTPSCWRH